MESSTWPGERYSRRTRSRGTVGTRGSPGNGLRHAKLESSECFSHGVLRHLGLTTAVRHDDRWVV